LLNSAEGMRRRRRRSQSPVTGMPMTKPRPCGVSPGERHPEPSPVPASVPCLRDSRKEVIQPQVPLRLPCYDFTPVADLTVVGCLPGLPQGWRAALRSSQLPWCDGRCVQGPGTYSPRHADPRLLAIPTSCSRVAESNPNYDRLSGISSPSRVGCPLYRPLYYVCSPTHKGHEDLTSSPPSSGLSPAVPLECSTECSN